MSRRFRPAAAFSLVEITLALGVAAFCLVAILGMLPVGLNNQQTAVQQTTANAIISQIVADLRAAVRLPPGQQSKQFSLHPHNGGAWDPTPDYVYFTNYGKSTGSNQQTAPADAAFRATINYIFPPTDTTSLAYIVISWPAAQSDLTKVSGSVATFAAINR
jgi:type II secretory pathway pseudopilin PulG